MSILSESLLAPQGLQAVLDAGLETLSNQQTVTFTQYTKSVLSTDGYVFWVKSATTQNYVGSLHQVIEQHQDEDQIISINKIIFTSEQEITQFNTISPTTLWVGSWTTDGNTLQVVFNETAAIYRQAGLWHYSGDAVYPALQSQLINSITDLPTGPIVSNSLPIWLTQNSYAPVYPSYLIPENLVPPYITVHIEPGDTKPLEQFPAYNTPVNTGSNLYTLSSTQLMTDVVQLTLYGFTNQKAIQYLNSLFDYSLNTDNIGFCNSPSINDGKRKQTEIAALAMQKKITIVASYYQSTVDAVARRYILSAGFSSITTQ